MRVWFAIFVAACGSDPTLAIEVVHPTGLAVASTTVSVYLESADLTCDAVEFGDVPDDELAGALVTEETLFANAAPKGSLAGIPRVDPKVVVARGFGNDGSLVAAGCVEVDAISDTTSVTITTVVAANVSIALVDPSRTTDAFGVAVTATDPSGNALENRHVSWRVSGPAGSAPAITTGIDMLTEPSTWQLHAPVCTSSGLATIHPAPPANIGGYATQVRVSWASTPIALQSALTPIDVKDGAATFTPPSNPGHACAIGQQSSGAQVIACIDGNNVSLFAVSVTSGHGVLTSAGTKAVSAVALYTLPSGDIIAIDNKANQTAITGGSAPKSCTSGGCIGLSIDDAAFMPACGSEPEKLILHDAIALPASGTLEIKQMDLATGAVSLVGVKTNALQETINATGCATVLDVTSGSPSVEQVLVIDDGTLAPQSRAEFECNGTKCASLELPIATASVGFGAGSSPFLILTTLDASGVELEEGVIEHGDDTGHFITFARLPSVSAPSHIATGQLDDDGQPDLVWTNSFKHGDLIEVAYARTINGVPLSALSPSTGVTVAQMIVGDVTGDGHDDVVITTDPVVTLSALVVIPTGVAADNGTVPTDTACTQ